MNAQRYDPMSDVIDQSLRVNREAFAALRALRESTTFDDLPGAAPKVAAERRMMVRHFRQLIDQLLEGVNQNPSKRWVLEQLQPHLQALEMKDTEVREYFGTAVGEVMQELGISSSDGLLTHYLGGV